MALKISKFSVLIISAVITIGLTGCSENEDQHIHTFQEEWSFNDDLHWHEATCEHSAVKGSLAPHNWQICNLTDSSFTKVCSDCQKNLPFTVPADFRYIPDADIYMYKSEIPYSVWTSVYEYAIANGYTFANAGTAGNGTAVEAEKALMPVTNISWRDAVVWCNAASEMDNLIPVYTIDGQIVKTAENYNEEIEDPEAPDNAAPGKGQAEKALINDSANGYRLPAEKEWELAAKAGTDSDFSGGNSADSVAWYSNNSSGAPHPVALKNKNLFGLFDMSGNVWEMCQNIGASGSNYRACRGGCWLSEENKCKVTSRTLNDPTYSSSILGFRIVRNIK